MWLSSFLAAALLAGASSSAEPGLLRVPKVYNAVITSNQNLAPSRAYPVIQPVVHRTAIGYVPPFYYPQLGPDFPGPQVVPLDPGVLSARGGPRETGRRDDEAPPARPEDVESVETTDGASPNSSPPKKISRTNSSSRDVESSSGELSAEQGSSDKEDKKGKKDRVPLSFYPNYQSLYYDPYFYPYNAFPPHLAAPGTYYVDYPQPPGLLGPLPVPPIAPGIYPVPPGRPQTPPEDSSQNSRNQGQKQKIRPSEKRDKIPDVPPPPLPTAARKKTS